MSNVVNHPFEPIYDKNSKILILGSMPSIKSREANFYYMNPQNRFWKVISTILDLPLPESNDEKRKMLLDNGIAVWDVLKSCEIEGSLDSAIRNPVPNDFSKILNESKVKTIFTAGNKATSLYKTYCSKHTGIESIYLPSTSPANNKYYSYETLLDEWRIILQYIN